MAKKNRRAARGSHPGTPQHPRGNSGRRGAGPRGRGRSSHAISSESNPEVQARPEANTWQAPDQAGCISSGNAFFHSTPANYTHGRGRGRGLNSFTRPPRASSFRARGGRAVPINLSAPLSSLLYQERPLLQPIKFVRSMYTPTLFQVQEDILLPMAEEVGIKTGDRGSQGSESHAAVRMTQVLSGELSATPEKLEEVAFDDMGQLLSQVSALTTEQSTFSNGDTSLAAHKHHIVEEANDSPLLAQQADILDSDEEQEEELIVYDAPYPRSQGNILPLSREEASETSASLTLPADLPIPAVQPPLDPELPALPSIATVKFNFPSVTSASKQPRFPVGPRGKILSRQLQARLMRKRKRKALGSFGLFGALLEERKLQFTPNDEPDPRWKDRRQGDSDLDWGDNSDNETEDVGGGMSVDVDLDVNAMSRFAEGMSAGGSKFMTMDDIKDAQKMQEEDAEDEGESVGDSADESDGDEEENRILVAEERRLLGESSSEEDSSEGDSDTSSDVPFQEKLQKVRGYARPTEVVNGKGSPSGRQKGWEDVDAMLKSMLDAEAMLDHNDRIFGGDHLDKEEGESVFRAVMEGDFDDLILTRSSNWKGKNKAIPPELEDLWNRDRLTKVERKRERQLERLRRAADPLAVKKGGKKGKKAMLTAQRLEDAIILPNRIVDITTLVQQIRRFTDVSCLKQTMALPPMETGHRKKVHELAHAFSLKSKSQGSGNGRYISLIKTTKTVLAKVDEKKIARVLGNHRKPVQRQREGEEVGKAAPKIGNSNIGYQMLMSMGWSEGNRIGISGGLDVPLTAVIKHSRLGLGAK